jgi:hypothetical protein
VVVEAPSTTSGAEAQTMAGLADLAILVVTSEATRDEDVADARAQLEFVRTPILGTVVVGRERRARRRIEHEAAPAVMLDAPAPVSSPRPARTRTTVTAAEPARDTAPTLAGDARDGAPDTQRTTADETGRQAEEQPTAARGVGG